MSNDGLDNNKTDIIVAALKGSAGAIPYAGGIAAELIGNLIPNQRMDRLVIYTRGINERLEALEEHAKQKLLDAEAIDIFEDGAHQAVRALSPKRQEYIANLVAFGMTGEQAERIQSKRLLNLLKEIDDAQIVILASYLAKNIVGGEFRELHHEILSPPKTHIGSSQEDLDKSTVYKLARSQLIAHGLIKESYSILKKDEIPDIDYKTGRLKSRGNEITPLGRLLLRRVGISVEEEL